MLVVVGEVCLVVLVDWWVFGWVMLNVYGLIEIMICVVISVLL